MQGARMPQQNKNKSSGDLNATSAPGGQRQYKGAFIAKAAPKAKFTGQSTDLEGHVYNLCGTQQADQYTRTTEEISIYIDKEYSYGGDISMAVKKGVDDDDDVNNDNENNNDNEAYHNANEDYYANNMNNNYNDNGINNQNEIQLICPDWYYNDHEHRDPHMLQDQNLVAWWRRGGNPAELDGLHNQEA
jgi:hypothetical protein